MLQARPDPFSTVLCGLPAELRNVVNILKSVVHSYIVRRANGGNAITDDLFELFLNILTDSSIKESVSLEPPAITSFLSVLTFLKASTRYRIPFFRHQTTEEQYVGIFLQSKMIRDQLCFPNLWPIDTIRDKMCLPSVGLQEILLHVFA